MKYTVTLRRRDIAMKVVGLTTFVNSQMEANIALVTWYMLLFKESLQKGDVIIEAMGSNFTAI